TVDAYRLFGIIVEGVCELFGLTSGLADRFAHLLGHQLCQGIDVLANELGKSVQKLLSSELVRRLPVLQRSTSGRHSLVNLSLARSGNGGDDLPVRWIANIDGVAGSLDPCPSDEAGQRFNSECHGIILHLSSQTRLTDRQRP